MSKPPTSQPVVFISAGAGKPGKPAVIDAQTGDIIAIATSQASAERIARAMNA